jgi:hypothetical protein
MQQSGMNELSKVNQTRRREIEAIVTRQVAAHKSATPPKFHDYPLAGLERRVAEALSAKWQATHTGATTIEVKFELIERARYGGDISLKLPELLRDGGPKQFIKVHLPWILELLSGPEFEGTFAKVEAKGMYINLTLADRWLLDGAQSVAEIGRQFGRNDSQLGPPAFSDTPSYPILPVVAAGYGWVVFASTVLIFMLAFLGLAYSIYPYIVIERLTVWEAASAHESLVVIFVGVAITLPAIVAYTIFMYRVFWGKAVVLSYAAPAKADQPPRAAGTSTPR